MLTDGPVVSRDLLAQCAMLVPCLLVQAPHGRRVHERSTAHAPLSFCTARPPQQQSATPSHIFLSDASFDGSRKRCTAPCLLAGTRGTRAEAPPLGKGAMTRKKCTAKASLPRGGAHGRRRRQSQVKLRCSATRRSYDSAL